MKNICKARCRVFVCLILFVMGTAAQAKQEDAIGATKTNALAKALLAMGSNTNYLMVESVPVSENAADFAVAAANATGEVDLKKADFIKIWAWESIYDAVEGIAEKQGLLVIYDYLSESDIKRMHEENSVFSAAKPVRWSVVLERVLKTMELGYYTPQPGVLEILPIEEVDLRYISEQQEKLRRNHKNVEANFASGYPLKTAIETISERAEVPLNLGKMSSDLKITEEKVEELEDGTTKVTKPPMTAFQTVAPMEWRAVLRNILIPFNLDFVESDGSVWPMAVSEAQAWRTKKEAAKPLKRRVVEIYHADVDDLIGKIEELGLLTAGRGKLVATQNDSSNTELNTVSSGSSGGGGASVGIQPRIKKGIVIIDVAERLDPVEEMIRKLDVTDQQVVIEVRILELSDTDYEKIGFNWTLGLQLATVSFGSQWSSDVERNRTTLRGSEQSTIGGSTMNSGITTPRSTSGSQSDFNTRETSRSDTYDHRRGSSAILGPLDASVLLDLIDTMSDADVISNPILVVGNRSDASITLIKEYPYIVTERGIDSDSGTVTYTYNWEVIDIGLTIWVMPEITPEGKDVRLSISLGKSELGEIKTDVNAGEYPEVLTSQISTRAVIPGGNTLVLGGLATTRQTLTTIKVPFLGSIPLIGRLFSHEEKRVEKGTLIMMFTPTILDAESPSTGYEGENEAKLLKTHRRNIRSAVEQTQEEMNASDAPEEVKECTTME